MMWNIAVVPVDSDQRCILELTQDSFRSKSDGWNCFASSHFNNRQLGCFRQIFEPLVEAALLFLNDPTVHSPVTKHQHIGPCRFPVRAPWQRTAFEAPQQVDAAGFSHAFGADGLTIFRRQGRTVLLHDGLDFLPSNQCTNLIPRLQIPFWDLYAGHIFRISGPNVVIVFHALHSGESSMTFVDFPRTNSFRAVPMSIDVGSH
mmetsp:Transcript_68450/g.150493  ORF Transcript_68450/g.150493 Transcript_68450/m.150493 type:complete len:203 (-) Transcript_68450:405-1013(-)